MDEYQKWSLWGERLTAASYDTGFNLCFQLIEAPAAEPDKWEIDFLVSSKKDPSDSIETAFSHFHLHLPPHSDKDLITDCSCPDRANPCKHIAGVYYLVASELDHNPFLLFELRGLAKG